VLMSCPAGRHPCPGSTRVGTAASTLSAVNHITQSLTHSGSGTLSGGTVARGTRACTQSLHGADELSSWSASTGNESVPKIIINNTINKLF